MKREGLSARAAWREGESWRRRSVRCQWITTGPELVDEELFGVDLDFLGGMSAMLKQRVKVWRCVREMRREVRLLKSKSDGGASPI